MKYKLMLYEKMLQVRCFSAVDNTFTNKEFLGLCCDKMTD